MNDWIDAEERIERAQQLCENKRWAEALDEVDQALEINPANGKWWSSRAFLLEQLCRHDEAVDAYQTALAYSPGDRDVLCSLGVNYVRTGQMLRAIETFEQLEHEFPDFEPAYCHRIMIYAELGEHDLAEQMFYMAQQIDDHCPHCYWHMGCSLSVRQDLDRAIFCWQRALEIEPDYAGARRRIAQAYSQQGDLESAQEYYLAEYRAHPGDAELLMEVGEMFHRHEQYVKAREKFKQAVELKPHLIRAYMMLADTLNQLGEPQEALHVYQQAILYDDLYPELNYKLGAQLMKAGRHTQARFHFLAELELQPSHRGALMSAGNCALELQDPVEAQTLFERLIEVDDRLPGAFHNLSVCHFLQDRYEDGIRYCQRAIELKPDYILPRHKLILANMRLGHWVRARQILIESLGIEPDDPSLQQLKRQWFYRRLSQWTQSLTSRIKSLVRHAESH